MNNPSLRTGLLIAASALMCFGVAGNALAVIPDLHGDLIEIGVRPSVLNTTVFHLYVGVMAQFAFAVIAAAAAFESMKGRTPARLPLAVIAVVHTITGVLAFSRSHSPHHLGPIVMGGLVAAAIAIPVGPDRST
jgi:hypothetical protein